MKHEPESTFWPDVLASFFLTAVAVLFLVMVARWLGEAYKLMPCGHVHILIP
jgi:hypothetical protein